MPQIETKIQTNSSFLHFNAIFATFFIIDSLIKMFEALNQEEICCSLTFFEEMNGDE